MDTVDGFSPQRLILARHAKKLKGIELAAQVGISSKRLTELEQGAYAPRPELVQAIATALGFPSVFFEGDLHDDINEATVSFRSAKSMTATVRKRALSRSLLAIEWLSPHFRKRFRYPEINLLDLSRETPEEAATQLRQHWKLGEEPITDLVFYLEYNGVEVYWQNEELRSLDALSLWRDDRPYVFLNSHKNAGDRSRFDAAHELGHLVMHRNVEDLSLAVIEDQANAFASAFLLPARKFLSDCPPIVTLPHLIPLKPKWKVSIQAMIRRCKDTNHIREWQYYALCKEVSRRGWRTSEPNFVEPEISMLHPKIWDYFMKQGFTQESFAELVGLPVDAILELCPTFAKMPQRPPRNRAPSLRVVSGGLAES